MNTGFELSRDERNSIVRSFQNGKTQIASTGLFEIHCDFDISKFPFDRQLCVIRISSTGYTIEMVSLHTDELALGDYVPNEQWDVLIGHSRERNLTFSSGRVYSALELDIYLDRKVCFFMNIDLTLLYVPI